MSNPAKLGPKLIEFVRPDVRSRYGDFKRQLMENLCLRHKLLSIPTPGPKNLANIGGERSYMFLGSLAKLEKALINWTMDELMSKHKFTPVVVPNILHDHIIERCGFPTKSVRSQVYKISSNCHESILDKHSTLSSDETKAHTCIAGTSEFALASIHIGDVIPGEELPKKFCALSRCYRAETSRTSSEWGLFRVHYFNKVEMLSFTMPGDSQKIHDEFLHIQKDLFSQLELEFQVLDMPESDLGLSAKKKYDIEAWMEGRQQFGEISSTSNCEDYQSSRLDIKYSKLAERGGQLQVDKGYVHTINGTACSTPRTLIAILEQHQTKDGHFHVPEPLVPYMNGATSIPTEEDELSLKEIDLNLNLNEPRFQLFEDNR